MKYKVMKKVPKTIEVEELVEVELLIGACMEAQDMPRGALFHVVPGGAPATLYVALGGARALCLGNLHGNNLESARYPQKEKIDKTWGVAEYIGHWPGELEA